MWVEAIEANSFGRNSEPIVILLNASVFSLKLRNLQSINVMNLFNIQELFTCSVRFAHQYIEATIFFLHVRFCFFLAGLQTQQLVFLYGCQAYMQPVRKCYTACLVWVFIKLLVSGRLSNVLDMHWEVPS